MFHKTKEDKTEEKEQEQYVLTGKMEVQDQEATTRFIR